MIKVSYHFIISVHFGQFLPLSKTKLLTNNENYNIDCFSLQSDDIMTSLLWCMLALGILTIYPGGATGAREPYIYIYIYIYVYDVCNLFLAL